MSLSAVALVRLRLENNIAKFSFGNPLAVCPTSCWRTLYRVVSSLTWSTVRSTMSAALTEKSLTVSSSSSSFCLWRSPDLGMVSVDSYIRSTFSIFFHFYLNDYKVEELFSPHCKTTSTFELSNFVKLSKPCQTPPQTFWTEPVLVSVKRDSSCLAPLQDLSHPLQVHLQVPVVDDNVLHDLSPQRLCSSPALIRSVGPLAGNQKWREFEPGFARRQKRWGAGAGSRPGIGLLGEAGASPGSGLWQSHRGTCMTWGKYSVLYVARQVHPMGAGGAG